MNKRYAPLAAIVVVAVISVYMIGVTYSNYCFYEPFDDPVYAHNTMTFGEKHNHLKSYPDNKVLIERHATYPAYSFYEMVNMADAIIIGNITDVTYYEETNTVYDITVPYVYTMYTVSVEKQIKGTSMQELQYTRMGGETEEVHVEYDGLTFDENDPILLILEKNDNLNGTVYMPVTLGAEYKILNGTHVITHNSPNTIPLEDFTSLIREKLDG